MVGSEITLRRAATRNVERKGANIETPSCARAPSPTSMVWKPSCRSRRTRERTISSQPALLHAKPAALPSSRAMPGADASMPRSKRSVTSIRASSSGHSRTCPCAGATATTAGGTLATGLGTSTTTPDGARRSDTRPAAPTTTSRAPASATASWSRVCSAQELVKDTLLFAEVWKFATTATRPSCVQPRRKTRTSVVTSAGVCTTSHSSRPNEPK
mmetsp:Transcript_1217/g.3726  ORF Transcript_1217/g.3726 Transcript_1217/m.3726 type:complete len:215 (+) Transcript_1217:1294-1938(+)